MPANNKLNVDVEVIDNSGSVVQPDNLSNHNSDSDEVDSDVLMCSNTNSNNNNKQNFAKHQNGINGTNNNINNNNNCKLLASLPNRKLHEKFIRESVDKLINLAVFDATDRENKVLEWQNPEELLQKFDMTLKENGDTNEQLSELITKTIKYSVKTGHPFFVNQLFSGVDPYGLVGQWLTDALNPSVYTYEVSPVFTLMEEIVLKQMREFVGDSYSNGDGIFCPGGSIANGYAISCARYMAIPDVKVKIMKFQSDMALTTIKRVFDEYRSRHQS